MVVKLLEKDFFVRLFAHSRLLVAGTNITSRRRRLPQHFQPGLAFGPGNDDRTAAIAPNIDAGAHHVEHAVDGDNQTDAFKRPADGAQNDCDRHQAALLIVTNQRHLIISA